nr:hypothetical protein [Actinomycetota bacterium]
MADTVDRSVLEAKAVSELKQIAKSMDLKVTGLKKAEIVDRIAGGSRNGGGSAPGHAPQRKPREKAPVAPPGAREQQSAVPAGNPASTPSPAPPDAPAAGAPDAASAGAPAAVRDDGAVDE